MRSAFFLSSSCWNCKVQSSDLLGFLNLLLVGLNLGLQPGGELSHAVSVLLVLILLELQLLHTALGPGECLVAILGLSLDSRQFHLQLADPHLELAHGGLASLHGGGLSISKAVLQITDLGVQSALSAVLSVGVILFSAELISQAGGINHGPLGLFLSILSLAKHVVNLSLESVDRALNIPLVMHSLRVDDLHLIDSIPGISKVIVQLLLGTVSRVQESPGLLNLTTQSISLPLSNANSLSDLLARAGLILISLNGVPQRSLVPLDGLLSFHVSLVGVVQCNLKFIDVRLELLLDPQGIGLGPLLSLKGCSH